jgi:tRNA (Thr-GGU) A37 N-methylase
MGFDETRESKRERREIRNEVFEGIGQFAASPYRPSRIGHQFLYFRRVLELSRHLG